MNFSDLVDELDAIADETTEAVILVTVAKDGITVRTVGEQRLVDEAVMALHQEVIRH